MISETRFPDLHLAHSVFGSTMPRRGAVALLAGLAGAGTVAADWSWLPWSGSVPSRPAGRVLVWGAGHGRTPSALADIPPATSVAVGDGIGAAVGADGSVHAFRPGSPSNLVAPAGSAVDVAVRSDPAEVVLLDASGRMHSSRVQADGTIAPSRLLAGALSGARARTVACGRSHCVSVTTSGHAIAWGSTNSHGQLGNGLVGACPDGTDPETPALMRTPPGKRIVQADAGDRHTVLVDDEGAVYGVGDDKWAQLGRSAEPWVEGNGGSSGDVEAASLIGDLPVQAAACGGQHTAVLVRDGTVFSFGYVRFSCSFRQLFDSSFRFAVAHLQLLVSRL